MSQGYAQSDMTLLLAAADTKYGNRGSFEYLWPAQSYPGVEKFLQKGPKGLREHTGQDLTFNVITGEQNTARMEGYFAELQTNQQDFPTTANVDHHTFHNYYLADEKELLEARGSETKLMDIIEVRNTELWGNMTELIEQKLMAQPSVTSGIDFFPGLFYWLVPCTSTQAASVAAGMDGAFQGGNPFDRSHNAFSTCGGISAATYSRWRNWCYQYDAAGSMSTRDKRITNRAMRRLKFKKPPTFKNIDTPQFNWSLYASEDRLEGIENLMSLSNENHGLDLGKYVDATTIKGVPIIEVPTWRNTTDYPVSSDATYHATSFLVGVNHNVFGVSILKGDYFKEHFTKPTARIHRKDVYLTMAELCRNRQIGGFVGATTA